MGISAALGLSTALGVGSSLFGASQQAGAASAASAEQVAALEQGEGDISQYFQQGKGELQPFQTAGVGATGQLSALLGIGGGGAQAQATLASLPGYQFSLAQGQQAQAAGITARGLGLSGAQLRGASDYAQGSAQQNYSNYATQLMNLAGLGENAGSGIASLAGQAGQSTAALAGGIGNAEAAGTIGQANAWSSGISGAAGALSSGANSLAGYGLYQQLLAGQSGAGGQYTQVGAQTIPSDGGSNYASLTTNPSYSF